MISANSKTNPTIAIAFLIIVLALPYLCLSGQAQSGVTFTPQDKFLIPENNGSISFAVNGSCSAATLKNGVWTFMDLTLSSSQPLGNLTVGAENSNVIISSFRAFNASFRSALLRFTVEGGGKQTVNLGLNLSRPSDKSEWSVVVPNSVFLPEGENWRLLPDDTVVITGLTGNVSVVRYSFRIPFDENLPFYLRHSVAIVTAAILAAVISVAVVIKVRARG